jgi:molybdopterin-guanine dinucleotide biosynthesis protein A
VYIGNEPALYFGWGDKKMDAKYAMHGQARTQFTDEIAFVNINTLTDLQDWRTQEANVLRRKV